MQRSTIDVTRGSDGFASEQMDSGVFNEMGGDPCCTVVTGSTARLLATCYH